MKCRYVDYRADFESNTYEEIELPADGHGYETPTEHAHPAPIGVTPVAATSTLVPHADCCDPMDMVGHFCLAVLAAIVALAVAMIFAPARQRPMEPGHLLAAVNALAARASPTGRARLAQLWRT